MKDMMIATRASCLSDLYQLLAILIKCPNRQILAGLLDGTIEEDCHSILADLEWPDVTARIVEHWDAINEQAESVDAEEFFSRLRQEYTRLFITPKAEEISLYEGIFLLPPGKTPDMGPLIMRSPAAMDARMCYRQAGLAMAEQGSADHMELELEFMSYLWSKIDENVEQEAGCSACTGGDCVSDGCASGTCASSGCSGVSASWQARKEVFETRHMRKWMADFFRACEEKTTHPYYRMVGILGQELAARAL